MSKDNDRSGVDEYPGPRYVGEDREAVYPSAAELEAWQRRYYDREWRRYLNGETSHWPDGPDSD